MKLAIAASARRRLFLLTEKSAKEEASYSKRVSRAGGGENSWERLGAHRLQLKEAAPKMKGGGKKRWDPKNCRA